MKMRQGARRGVALALALLAIVVIGTLIVGVFFSSMQEYRIGRSTQYQERAFTAAEYGLNYTISTWNKEQNLKLARGAVVTKSYEPSPGTTANVQITRLNDYTYWVVSTGSAGSSPATASTRRTSTVLLVAYPTVHAAGALTSNDAPKIAGNITIDGTDNPPPGWDCTGMTTANKAGVAVPEDRVGLVNTKGITGDPPILGTPLAADENTYTKYGDETWQTLTANADIRYMGDQNLKVEPRLNLVNNTCDTGVKTNWGDPKRNALVPSPCETYYPIVYVKGNLSVQAQSGGQGILLVEGTLSLAGGFKWNGLIIVMNDIKSTGTNEVTGGMMAANFVQDKPSESQITGGATILYSSCALETALKGSAQLLPAKERSWAELF